MFWDFSQLGDRAQARGDATVASKSVLRAYAPRSQRHWHVVVLLLTMRTLSER
jgi:hypothetical protein